MLGISDLAVVIEGIICAVALAAIAWKLPMRLKSGMLSVVVATVLLAAALAVVFVIRQQFLITAACMIPCCMLYIWITRQTPWHEALYLGCITFLSYDLALLVGSNVIFGELLGTVANVPQIARDVVLIIVTIVVMGCETLLMRRLAHGASVTLSAWQDLLILVPMVPYLYIRSGYYVMAFNGGIAAQYQGEIVLILLSLLLTIVVMVAIRQVLGAQIQQRDLLVMEAALTKQHQQYLIKRETIDLMNRKYHDMKHFASIMEASELNSATGNLSGNTANDASSLTKDLSGAMLFVDTSSPIVDVILSEKIRFCEEHNVRLVPFVDALRLDFVTPLDLCTLFGNALDNAIEAVLDIDQESLREVKAKVNVWGNMAVFTCVNAYINPIRPHGDVLASTKSEHPASAEGTSGRGYGMANMRKTVETYGGEMAFEATDGLFTLSILLPLPEEERNTSTSVA